MEAMRRPVNARAPCLSVGGGAGALAVGGGLDASSDLEAELSEGAML